MPKNITQYDLLISCPGDVQDEIRLIEETVNQFNTQFSDTLEIAIRTKHWSKDSYAQSGGKPQALLNKQFVNDCDAAIAIMWTRFGTQTDEFGSGTEEEIENMLSSGKQVFMYFSDKPLPPSLQNPDEYAKVQRFREKYKSKGIYFVYSSDDEFKKLFFAHITQYFLTQKRISEVKSERQSMLKLMGIDQNDKLIDNVPVQRFSPIVEHTVDEYKSIMRKMYSEIAEICVVKRSESEIENIFPLSFYKPVEIDEKDRKLLESIADALKINLAETFFDLGNLMQDSISISICGSGAIKGSAEEKYKYQRIQDLIGTISDALAWAPIEKAFSDKRCIKFAVQNCGTAVDEDVEITINMPKDSLLTINEFPGFSNEEMGYLLNDCEMRTLFGILSTPDWLDYYSSQKVKHHSPRMAKFTLPGQNPNYNEDFISELNSVFDYSIYETEKEYILKLKVDYIKHNTTVAFPSVIFIKESPKSIKYSITSKNSVSVIEGELAVE